MGVVVEMCAKCPGGPTRIRGTDMPHSNVDTTLGNKKGSLLNYGRYG